jgi:hypothetical protein
MHWCLTFIDSNILGFLLLTTYRLFDSNVKILNYFDQFLNKTRDKHIKIR